jgi:hypothetical protein
VGLLTLYAGLLLPWLGGALWLAFIESRLNSVPPNRLRQAGYGFFLGYTVLFLAIMANNNLTGAVSWPGLMLFLLLFAAGGGLALWLTPGSSGGASIDPEIATTAHEPRSTAVKMLTAVLLVWIAIHLIHMAVEIFTQPLYPWDAWVAWIYRAKAWSLAGGISDVLGPAAWAAATSADSYTIDAWMYPLFPSVIPYWAALSLGRWSETLINLPVLFAGMAIGLALYGQCRECGLSMVASLACCYLLLSIPLFATHIALAGYADIWMAGFAGLGFVAIMRGAIIRGAGQGFQMGLGLLMIILSIAVKNEGAVWFLAALALLVLVTCRLWVPILIVALVVGANWLGFTHIEIPLLGTLGIVNGRLEIPFIGSFVLEVHSVWRSYWDNFFTMGSWNLVWVLVTASLVLAIKPSSKSSEYRARRAGLGFIFIFLATQLFIFGYTDQGLWADTYTAINRLPLHFIPALLFAAVVVVHSRLTQRESISLKSDRLKAYQLTD